MFDLVRNKMDVKATIFTVPLKYNDYRILTAIPEREINISPDLAQNPEW